MRGWHGHLDSTLSSDNQKRRQRQRQGPRVDGPPRLHLGDAYKPRSTVIKLPPILPYLLHYLDYDSGSHHPMVRVMCALLTVPSAAAQAATTAPTLLIT